MPTPTRSDTSPSNQQPVIVIGAGIGGLSAALSLASQGVPVTLLERHGAPGGKMRQIDVADRLLDSGPTVFTMRWVFEALFQKAGLQLSDYLALEPATLLARHSWQDSPSLDLFADLEQSMAAISDFAGDREADNYQRFAQKTEAVFNTLDARFMRAQRPNPVALSLSGGLKGMLDMAQTQPFVSLWKSLSRDFTDPRLQQLFARYATYCGSSPFKAPATLMLIAHVEKAGVWLVKGGMQALAQCLTRVLQEQGVNIHFNTEVAEVDVHQGAVRGVVLADGQHLPAQAVVFNGETQAIATGRLGTAVQLACTPRSETSLSAVTRCQVARTQGYPLAHHTVFFGNDYTDEFDSIFKRQNMTQHPTVYVCAQDRAASAEASAPTTPHERLFSLVNAPARSLSEEEKQQAVERMTHTLSTQGLHIDDEQGETVITTPNQFEQLFPASDGALYGRPTHGWMGSFRRPGSKSRTRGLYLCGGSVHPGAGVPMACLSGQLAAEQLCADLSR